MLTAFLSSFLLALAAAAGAGPVSSEQAADAVAAEVFASGPHAGLTIAVSRKGRPVFLKGYGEADVNRHVAATSETIYPLCSISKNFAAAAILKLVEQGKLDLDSPLSRYFPKDPTAGRGVTVRQLLNHTSGLGSYNDAPGWDRIAARPVPHAEMLALISSASTTPPGRQWGYSNSAFYLAGLLVEQVSGRSYWAFLQTELLRPLGMTRAASCAAVPRTARAQGYEVTPGGLTDAEKESWENPYAGGGLCATAGNLLLWETGLDSATALRPESVSAMRTPTKLTGGPSIDYGLGTRLGSLEGHPVVGHTGSGQGFSTVLARYPADELTIVVLKNWSAGPAASIIAARLARRLLGLPPFRARDLPAPESLLQALSGNWVGDHGPYRLSAKDGRLHVELGDSGPTLTPSYQGESTFAAGEENLVRAVVANGRADWAFEYVGGLFAFASRRAEPSP